MKCNLPGAVHIEVLRPHIVPYTFVRIMAFLFILYPLYRCLARIYINTNATSQLETCSITQTHQPSLTQRPVCKLKVAYHGNENPL